MEVALAYAHRTSLATLLGVTALDFAANLRRRPVSFRGRVTDPLLLRQLLAALHESILSDTRWASHDAWERTLDPIITVHRDQMTFEAFSTDQSTYARLAAPLAAFEAEGETRYGTTNIDFTADLAQALSSLRSSRRTVFAVGAEGFGVTTGIGAAGEDHFERKVDVPESWVKSFLQVQGALAMRPFVFDVRPADLLSLIAYFQDNKPPTLPHGLRYELRPGAPITAVLEPWERRMTFHGATYGGYERVVRVWGRRRLTLLESVLPYADRVTIGVLGRGLPHLYVCHCGPYQFTYVLSGWAKNDWSRDAAFDLLAPRAAQDPAQVERVRTYLGEHLVAPAGEIAANTGLAAPAVEQALFALCRAGRAMVDPTTSQYRQRELFAEPLDLAALFAPDPRLEEAQRLLDAGRVRLGAVTPPKARDGGRQETRAEAAVTEGDATYAVSIRVDGVGRLRFGRCQCAFFERNMMARGPCAHIMAARLALDAAPAPAAAG
jgi:hypothetical protein